MADLTFPVDRSRHGCVIAGTLVMSGLSRRELVIGAGAGAAGALLGEPEVGSAKAEPDSSVASPGGCRDRGGGAGRPHGGHRPGQQPGTRWWSWRRASGSVGGPSTTPWAGVRWWRWAVSGSAPGRTGSGPGQGAGRPDVQDVHQGRADPGVPGQADALTGLIPPLPPPDAKDFDQLLGKIIKLQETVPRQEPWTAANGSALDGQTAETFKLANSSTYGARFLFDLAVQAVFAADPRDLSLLHMLFYFHSGNGIINLTSTAGGAQDSRFHGGSQLVSIRLAATSVGGSCWEPPCADHPGLLRREH